MDFPRAVGTPVYAAKDGIVVYQGCNNSFTSGSYNSCTVGVTVGSTVKQWQQLGTVGARGNS